MELARAGDLKSAETELRKAVALAPNDSALLTSLGGILGMEGDLHQANRYFAKAVKLNPHDPVSLRNLAANQWQLGRLKEAHENLDLLLRLNPQDKTAIFLMGIVSEREKDYGRSIQLLESIPDVVERQPEASVALASAYYHMSRRDNARSVLQKLPGRAVKPDVVFMGGRVAMDAHDYPLAEALLSTIRSTYTDPAAVESQIAFAQYRQGHAVESEKTLLAAKQARHANRDAYLLLCKLLADRRAYDRALQTATEAEQTFPDSFEVLSTKASMQMKLQYFSDAVVSLQKATRLHPSSETKRDLAMAEWRAGSRKQAMADFDQVLTQFPRDGQTFQVYGTLLLEDGSPEANSRAIELLKQAVVLDDSTVEARYQLANLELANEKPQAALRYLERAMQLEPNDSRLHFAMSRAYRRLGRTSEADQEMATYQKLKPAEQPAERR